MPFTKLSAKGRVVIPKEIRNTLGLKPGDRFFIQIDGDIVLLKPLRENEIESLFGKFKGVNLLSDLREEHLREKS